MGEHVILLFIAYASLKLTLASCGVYSAGKVQDNSSRESRGEKCTNTVVRPSHYSEDTGGHLKG